MYKSRLQELCQQRKWEIPEYKTAKQGQDHSPRFQATVTVNGLSFQSQSIAKSSKEAQNDAAKLAFDHFSLSRSSSSSSCSSPSSSSSSSSTYFTASSGASNGVNSLVSNINSTTLQKLKIQETNQSPQGNGAAAVAKTDVKFTGSSGESNGVNSHLSTGGTLQQPKIQETNQTPQRPGTAVVAKNDDMSTDMQHLYKNQLQSYAQKGNLTLPVYSCERMGPPHASRFKSKVTIDGKTYESEEYFPTLNRAEHAAAKVALMSLLPNGVQEDESGYKNLLQELVQKECFHLPVYSTNKSGEAHAPIFVSTVEIGGRIFTGQEARTKKQAEMSAAKVAYMALKQRNSRQTSVCLSPASEGQEAPQLSTCSLRSNLTAYLQQNVQPKLPMPSEQAEEEKASDEVSSTYLAIASPGPESSSAIKRVSASSAPSISSLPEQDPSSSSLTSDSSNFAVSLTIERLVGRSTLCQNRVVVHPCEAKVTYPAGSTVLPISNDAWRAVKLPTTSSQ